MSQYLFRKGGSVASLWVTSYSSGDSRLFSSASAGLVYVRAWETGVVFSVDMDGFSFEAAPTGSAPWSTESIAGELAHPSRAVSTNHSATMWGRGTRAFIAGDSFGVASFVTRDCARGFFAL